MRTRMHLNYHKQISKNFREVSSYLKFKKCQGQYWKIFKWLIEELHKKGVCLFYLIIYWCRKGFWRLFIQFEGCGCEWWENSKGRMTNSVNKK